MKRALVTGGAGFIGSHLCERLIAEGFAVVCLDNLITGDIHNLVNLKKEPKFEFLKKDASKPIRLNGKLDWVFHFASPASPIDYLELPIETMKAGSFAVYYTLELAKEKGASYFLASTSEVYGDPEVHPQKEDYWGNVNPIGPRAVYDEAKRFAEAMTHCYHRYYKLDIRHIRIFNTYGPRMRLNDGRVVPNFIGQALLGKDLTVFGDGTQTRSFCYVDDLIEGIVRLQRKKYFKPVNLGTPVEISILDFAKRIISLVGSKSKIVYKPLPEDDPKQRKPDITLAKRILGWEPKVGLDEGLRITIEYFKKKLGVNL
jgi:dTDP-glucose 4,6-dehydratase